MTVDVVIVGAGVSGLAAAHALHCSDPSLSIGIYEASGRIGGKLLTGQIAGVTVDLGAEAMLARRPEGIALVDALGLRQHIVHPASIGAGLALGGRIAPIPAESVMGVPTSVRTVAASRALSAAGLAALEAGNPAIEVLHDDVSVAQAIAPRVGTEVLDRLVEPLLAGVYAGRADRLSIEATLPALYAQLRRTPDLLVAAQAVRASAATARGPVFASLLGGIGGLPAQLLAATGASLHLNTPVREISQTPQGFLVHTGPRPESVDVATRAVILATPAAKSARLLSSVASGASSALEEIESASMALILLAYRRADLARDIPAGSGLLVPASLGTAVKAATFLTQKWPHLAADAGDLILIRASIGRAGETAALQRDDAELTAMARRDLAVLAGISGVPIDSIVQRWGGGLPQYDVGHRARVQRVRTAVATVPGVEVAGAAYDGVGIPACIGSGQQAAARILSQRVLDQRVLDQRATNEERYTP